MKLRIEKEANSDDSEWVQSFRKKRMQFKNSDIQKNKPRQGSMTEQLNLMNKYLRKEYPSSPLRVRPQEENKLINATASCKRHNNNPGQKSKQSIDSDRQETESLKSQPPVRAVVLQQDQEKIKLQKEKEQLKNVLSDQLVQFDFQGNLERAVQRFEKMVEILGGNVIMPKKTIKKPTVIITNKRGGEESGIPRVNLDWLVQCYTSKSKIQKSGFLAGKQKQRSTLNRFQISRQTTFNRNPVENLPKAAKVVPAGKNPRPFQDVISACISTLLKTNSDIKVSKPVQTKQAKLEWRKQVKEVKRQQTRKVSTSPNPNISPGPRISNLPTTKPNLVQTKTKIRIGGATTGICDQIRSSLQKSNNSALLQFQPDLKQCNYLIVQSYPLYVNPSYQLVYCLAKDVPLVDQAWIEEKLSMRFNSKSDLVESLNTYERKQSTNSKKKILQGKTFCIKGSSVFVNGLQQILLIFGAKVQPICKDATIIIIQTEYQTQTGLYRDIINEFK